MSGTLEAYQASVKGILAAGGVDPKGLVGAWPFKAKSAGDHSGLGNDGVVTGTVPITDETGAEFSSIGGDDPSKQIATSGDADLELAEFAFITRFRLDSDPDTTTYYPFSRYDIGNHGWGILLRGTGMTFAGEIAILIVRSDNSDAALVSNSVDWSLGWQTVAVSCRDGLYWDIHINGSKAMDNRVGTATFKTSLSPTFYPGGRSAGSRFDGMVASGLYFNRNLSDAEHLKIHNLMTARAV